jgi:short-subunit dehydrogenase
MSRRDLRGARALLTGASSGIGAALARELARREVRLALFARRAQRLEALASELALPAGAVACVAGDVTNADDRRRALDACRERLGGLDLVINNAGIGAIGRFDQAKPERLRAVLEVNFFAPAELIREALPLLKQGHEPLVVNVGSILGYRGIPAYTEYCASKFALRGFSEALRAELARDAIGLLHVAPSRTQTEFFDQVLDSTGPAALPGTKGQAPEEVARAIVRAMVRGRKERVIGAGGRLLVALTRFAPRLADWAVNRFGGGE